MTSEIKRDYKDYRKDYSAKYYELNRESFRSYYAIYYIQNKVYHCNVCNKSFGTNQRLQTHFRSLKHRNANEKVKSFEQLLTNVHEMIQNGTFLQALENFRETNLWNEQNIKYRKNQQIFNLKKLEI